MGFRHSGTLGIVPSSNVTWVLLISYFQFDYQTDGALVATQNLWFLHTTNIPVAEQQLSPHQVMHTHISYFIFYPNFFHLFSLSIIRAKSLESQTRMSRKSATNRCVISHGSYFDAFSFWLGFLLCWKVICFLISVFWFLFFISVFDCWFLISVF